jgi:hypothetical protein
VWPRRRRYFDIRATADVRLRRRRRPLGSTRRDRLDKAIEAIATESEFIPIVRRLSCRRGVPTLTAFALAVEIGDRFRFTGNTIGSLVEGSSPARTPPAPFQSKVM